MPPAPKDPDKLVRRNIETQKAEVEAKGEFELPEIDEGSYHRMTVDFWDHVRESEFAGQFVGLDLANLYVLREMVDGFWRSVDMANIDLNYVREIRLLGKLYGLSPMDRRALKWKVVPAAVGVKHPTSAADGTETAAQRKARLRLVS